MRLSAGPDVNNNRLVDKRRASVGAGRRGSTFSVLRVRARPHLRNTIRAQRLWTEVEVIAGEGRA